MNPDWCESLQNIVPVSNYDDTGYYDRVLKIECAGMRAGYLELEPSVRGRSLTLVGKSAFLPDALPQFAAEELVPRCAKAPAKL